MIFFEGDPLNANGERISDAYSILYVFLIDYFIRYSLFVIVIMKSNKFDFKYPPDFESTCWGMKRLAGTEWLVVSLREWMNRRWRSASVVVVRLVLMRCRHNVQLNLLSYLFWVLVFRCFFIS